MVTCKDCIHFETCKAFSRVRQDVMFTSSSEAGMLCSRFADKSRFIELPCKIGDEVYVITKAGYPYHGTHIQRHYHVEPREFTYAHIPNIGKSVFLTREKAEAALAERTKKK